MVCYLQKDQDKFASKTDTGSAELYFHYYGMLMHQQNMLQDQIRTGTYYAAILENTADFQGKTIMDVGAGSGILSLFAAQVTHRTPVPVQKSSCWLHRLSGRPFLTCRAFFLVSALLGRHTHVDQDMHVSLVICGQLWSHHGAERCKTKNNGTWCEHMLHSHKYILVCCLHASEATSAMLPCRGNLGSTSVQS